MKKIFTLLAVSASLAVFAPASSQAFDGHHHGPAPSRSFAHNCGNCGSAVYRERVITGYDRHHHPIFGWRIVNHTCRPMGHHHGSSFGQFRPSAFPFHPGRR